MLIDLSHPIEEGMTTYPGLPGPVVSDHLSREDSKERYEPGTQFHIGRIDMVANTGTYLDTPFHRDAGAEDLSGIALDRCADLRGVCVAVGAPEIGPAALDGTDVEGGAVLLHTGWDRHWRTDRYGDPGHPHLSGEGAAALIERGARLVGIDSVNIDDTRGPSRPAHTLLLRAGVLIVEHLTGLGDLVGRDFRFFAVPAPVRGLGSFPVRAFAIV